MSLRFAGFLPVAEVNGEWSALLGLERGGWGAFGGGLDAADENDPSRTAIREALEESHGGLLRSELIAAERCQQQPLLRTRHAVVFAIVIPKTLHLSMNAVFAPFRYSLSTKGCFEKSRAQWFPLKKLSVSKKFLSGHKLRAPITFSFEEKLPLFTSLSEIYESSRWTLDAIEQSMREITHEYA